jgi:hypothetical protein
MEAADTANATGGAPEGAPAATSAARALVAPANHLGASGLARALDVLLGTWVSALCALIEAHVRCAARNAIAAALRQAPVWCSEAAHVLAHVEAARYPWLMCYEQERLGRPLRRCACDGAPRAARLLDVPTTLTLPASFLTRERSIERAFERERAHSVRRLESLAPGTARSARALVQLGELVDVARSVPLAVRIYVARVRALFVALREAQGARAFASCAHAQCERTFYRGLGPPPTVDLFAGCAHARARTAHDAHRFCSRACAEQWWREWDARALPAVDAARARARDAPSALARLRSTPMAHVARDDVRRACAVLIAHANARFLVARATARVDACARWRAMERVADDEAIERALEVLRAFPAETLLRSARDAHPALRVAMGAPTTLVCR